MKLSLSGLFSRLLPSRLRAPVEDRPESSQIRASFDTQWFTDQNAQHWSMARGGDAQIAFNFGTRRRTRLNARYEAANNTHLRGMVDTKTSDMIGCVGLQMHDESQQAIEREWHAWSQEIELYDKLQQILGPGKMTDGEGLGLIGLRDELESPVKLDIMPFESEQMGNPYGMRDDHEHYDGVHHRNGTPLAYYVYDWNPDGHHRFNPQPYVGEWYEPWRVIHIYKRYRAGQLRGATELGPGLELSAILRRYTLATLGSAELAAETGLVQETDAAVDCPASDLDSENQFVPWMRNMLYTAPYGWKIKQLKPEQPIEQYHQFVRAIVTQMGRALGMPAVLCYGDSSDYNMASGRLDVQAYVRALDFERKSLLEPTVLERVFKAWLRYYLAARAGISIMDLNSDRLRKSYGHTWTYRPINHSDPEKQAKADVELWQAGLITDVDWLYSRNKDPQTHYEQLEAQNTKRASLGMPMPGQMPGMPEAAPAGEPSDDQQ